MTNYSIVGKGILEFDSTLAKTTYTSFRGVPVFYAVPYRF